MKRLLVALFLGTFLVCCVGAVGTAIQMAQTGLGATPPPSTLGTVFRAASVMLAIVLWPMARRAIEHITVVTFILGAGASVLIGLGLRSGFLDVVRVTYHLLMFSSGAVAMLGLVADAKAGRFSGMAGR